VKNKILKWSIMLIITMVFSYIASELMPYIAFFLGAVSVLINVLIVKKFDKS
jgi:uncharacterized membrane protein AbrB (regulator of aidB expression)